MLQFTPIRFRLINFNSGTEPQVSFHLLEQVRRGHLSIPCAVFTLTLRRHFIFPSIALACNHRGGRHGSSKLVASLARPPVRHRRFLLVWQMIKVLCCVESHLLSHWRYMFSFWFFCSVHDISCLTYVLCSYYKMDVKCIWLEVSFFAMAHKKRVADNRSGNVIIL